MVNQQRSAFSSRCPMTGAQSAGMAGGMLLVAVNLLAADMDLAKLPPPVVRDINFDTDVKPIFDQHCLRCHGPARPKGGFQLDDYAAFLRAGHNGPVVTLGNSTNSTLIHRVARLDPDSAMPPEGEGEPLAAEQVAVLRAWVDQGAWWGREEDKLKFNLTLAPAAGYTEVSGNESKFRQLAGQRDGWRGGVESFEL